MAIICVTFPEKAVNGETGASEELQTLRDTEQPNGEVAFVDTPTLQDLTFMIEKVQSCALLN